MAKKKNGEGSFMGHFLKQLYIQAQTYKKNSNSNQLEQGFFREFDWTCISGFGLIKRMESCKNYKFDKRIKAKAIELQQWRETIKFRSKNFRARKRKKRL